MPNILEMMRARGLNLDQFSGPPQPAPIMNEVPNYPMRPDQIYNTLDNSPPDVGYMPPMDESMLQGIDVAPRGQGDSEIPIARVAPAIQEWLGAKEPTDNGIVGRLLANRRPSSDFIGDAAVQTLMTGKPTSSRSLAQEDFKSELEPLTLLYKLRANAAGGGGVLGEYAQQIMDDNPGMNFTTAFGIAKSGLGQGMGIQGGEAGLIPGFGGQRQQLKYDERLGTRNADIGTAYDLENQQRQAELATADEIAKQSKIGSMQGEIEGSNLKKANSAQSVLPLIREARGILPQATSGGAQSLGAMGKGAVGYSDAATQADARLNLIAAGLTASVPRFEGPQGVLDVRLYQQAAADVGNRMLPYQDRLAALDVMERLQLKYIDQAGQEPNTPSQNVIRYDAQGNRL